MPLFFFSCPIVFQADSKPSFRFVNSFAIEQEVDNRFIHDFFKKLAAFFHSLGITAVFNSVYLQDVVGAQGIAPLPCGTRRAKIAGSWHLKLSPLVWRELFCGITRQHLSPLPQGRGMELVYKETAVSSLMSDFSTHKTGELKYQGSSASTSM
jgi:hypothetical protein